MTRRQREPLRADARQNRERLVEVARDALTASTDVPLTAIARQAGVGSATLYRHFPNREALVLAVCRRDVQQLADAAPALLDEHPPPEALRRWLDGLARYGAMRSRLDGAGASLDGEADEPLRAALARLLDAGAATGELRPDLDPGDVLLLLGFLWRGTPDAGGRMLDVVVAGLRQPMG